MVAEAEMHFPHALLAGVLGHIYRMDFLSVDADLLAQSRACCLSFELQLIMGLVGYQPVADGQ
jgi:hypothetical protein